VAKVNRSDIKAFMRDLLREVIVEGGIEENLRDWVKAKWVRIDSSGNIAGACGTSKNQKNPDRCLPIAKARSLTKSQRAATAAKKKKAGSKGAQVVSNTKAAKVTKEQVMETLSSMLIEKSGYSPTQPDKWSYAISQAKAKYDTYPSALANLWASKKYKELGGRWRKKKKKK
jgi:hypothetical protein